MAKSPGAMSKNGGAAANYYWAKHFGGLRVAANPSYNYQNAEHVYDRN